MLPLLAFYQMKIVDVQSLSSAGESPAEEELRSAHPKMKVNKWFQPNCQKDKVSNHLSRRRNNEENDNIYFPRFLPFQPFLGATSGICGISCPQNAPILALEKCPKRPFLHFGSTFKTQPSLETL